MYILYKLPNQNWRPILMKKRNSSLKQKTFAVLSFYLNMVSHYWNHSSKKQSFKGKSFLALQLSLINKVVSLLGLHLGFSGCDSIWLYDIVWYSMILYDIVYDCDSIW